MRRAVESPPDTGSRRRAWALRGLVLGLFAVTIAVAGPRAWRVAKAELRIGSVDGALVDVGRVGLVEAPEWARGPALRAVLRDLEPRLRGSVRILDDDGARSVLRSLELSPFVERVRLDRQFPDRFRVDLILREPICVLSIDREPVAALDAGGVLLPLGGEILRLPVVGLDGPWPLDPSDFGQPAKDARVRAAVRVAVEWRERVAPSVPDAPDLAEVDARNLGWNYVTDPLVSQIVVVLSRRDGETATFQYGRAEDDDGPLEAATRAEILRRVLEAFPGLEGIERGDLRLANRWREKLRLERVATGEAR